MLIYTKIFCVVQLSYYKLVKEMPLMKGVLNFVILSITGEVYLEL